MAPYLTPDSQSSRRQILQATAGIAGLLAATARRAVAQIKISQAAAGYQDHPNDKKQCADCIHFTAPDKCQLIAGAIRPQGWCRLFSPKPQRAAATARGPT
jgi:hypothetical protein